MDFQIDPKYADAFAGLTGSRWPEPDENALRDLSLEYNALAGEFSSIADELATFVQAVTNSDYQGEAAQAFVEYARQFITPQSGQGGGASSGQSEELPDTDKPPHGGPTSPSLADRNSPLGQGAHAADQMSRFLWKTAADVEYMKMQAIGQLIIMFMEIAIAIAMVVPTFGASLLNITAIRITTAGILRLALQLTIATIVSLAMELVFGVALDAIIQKVQIDQGVRSVKDPELTKSALQSAAVSGALGGLGSPVSRSGFGGRSSCVRKSGGIPRNPASSRVSGFADRAGEPRRPCAPGRSSSHPRRSPSAGCRCRPGPTVHGPSADMTDRKSVV